LLHSCDDGFIDIQSSYMKEDYQDIVFSLDEDYPNSLGITKSGIRSLSMF